MLYMSAHLTVRSVSRFAAKRIESGHSFMILRLKIMRGVPFKKPEGMEGCSKGSENTGV